MPRMRDEFSLLLDGLSEFEVRMASGLLEEAGIPSVRGGPDFDVAELGVSGHSMVRGASLFVPRGALEPARRVLEEAGWHGEGSEDGGGESD